jgi:hypothetical protein
MTGRFVRRFKPARLSCKRAASFARCDPCKSSAPEAVILFMSRRPPCFVAIVSPSPSKPVEENGWQILIWKI